MADEEAHVDRAVERVENEVEVAVGGEFAAVDAALQSLVGLSALGPQKSVAKGLEQFRIGLASGEQRGDDLAASERKMRIRRRICRLMSRCTEPVLGNWSSSSALAEKASATRAALVGHQR